MDRPRHPAPNPRRTAQTVLRRVLDDHRTLDEAFVAVAAKLPPRERGFLRALVTETLRRLGQVDAALDQCLTRPLAKAAPPVRAALRLGATQLLFLGVDPHAAVNETVALLRRDRTGRGLVNAVLRRLDREGRAWVDQQDPARLNTPDWLWQSWTAVYGEAQARAMADGHLAEPPLDISVKEDPSHWAKELDAEILPSGSLRCRGGGDVTTWPGYAQGAWWVQDAAAAMPARLLDPKPGMDVVDLCAAPGGKTAQLVAGGARVTAVDRSESRAKILAANLKRLKLTAETVTADATTWQPPRPVDAVLLDAPCSATGTLRRHPDVAWHRRPRDIANLTAIQDRLLDAAAALVRPGGRLVYCVCSLQEQEGEARIDRFLGNHTDFRTLAVREDEVGGAAEFVTTQGWLRTLPAHWPELGGLDGFFAARLVRDA